MKENISKILVGDFSTSHSIMTKTIREKISKKIQDLNNTTNLLNVTYI